jgi:hypothetical protein
MLVFRYIKFEILAANHKGCYLHTLKEIPARAVGDNITMSTRMCGDLKGDLLIGADSIWSKV